MSQTHLTPRLAAEIGRLFGDGQNPNTAEPSRTRLLGLELIWPGHWPTLARVWQGVQHDLGFPEPVIVVNGRDAMALWFGLQAPVDAQAGLNFLDGLCQRYLTDIGPERRRCTVHLDPASVPSRQAETGWWSAFVSAELAPVFADEPGLDIAPNPEGQAELLSRTRPASAGELEAALRQLGSDQTTRLQRAPGVAMAPAGPVSAREFLSQVMNDPQHPWALRVEAAKALLATER